MSYLPFFANLYFIAICISLRMFGLENITETFDACIVTVRLNLRIERYLLFIFLINIKESVNRY